jgi:hypothetical protein
MMDRKLRERDRITEHNVGVILRKTRSGFQRLIQEEAIGKRLRDRYSEGDLAAKLYENGSPLINFSSDPIFGQPSNFLAVKFGIIEGDEQYFREVVEEISDKSGAKGQQAKLVLSEGAHKCALIYTIDVINADCLTAYEDLSTAYRQFIDDRRLLHNFPAEVNAVYYEQRVRDKLQLAYRMFNPRIVFMLEYKEWVRQFNRCKVYDLVKLDTDKEGNQFWALHLPEGDYNGRKYNAQVIELTPHVAQKAELLTAMNTFVFKRKDCRKEFEIPIHYDQLVMALILVEEKEGDKAANITKLRSVIESGFIHDFKSSGEQYERDLGDLMHVMLLDEIDRLSL